MEDFKAEDLLVYVGDIQSCIIILLFTQYVAWFYLVLTFNHQVVRFDYGYRDADPLDRMYFYRKSNPDVVAMKLGKEQVSLMLPTVFCEMNVRVYCKRQCHEECCKAIER